jgi:hypothetical protein
MENSTANSCNDSTVCYSDSFSFFHKLLLIRKVDGLYNAKYLFKNGVFWDLRCVALVRTNVSEKLSASFIRVTTIGELGTTVVVTSNRRTFGISQRGSVAS